MGLESSLKAVPLAIRGVDRKIQVNLKTPSVAIETKDAQVMTDEVVVRDLAEIRKKVKPAKMAQIQQTTPQTSKTLNVKQVILEQEQAEKKSHQPSSLKNDESEMAEYGTDAVASRVTRNVSNLSKEYYQEDTMII